MTTKELKKILHNHNLWLKEDGGECANLRGVDLEGADLEGANLEGANLRHAYLEGTNLQGANLQGADLRYAYLRHVYLRDANLQDADLRDANLRHTYLQGADLRWANLQGANLQDANLQDAELPSGYAFYSAIPWCVTIAPDRVLIGCQSHSLETWQNFSNEKIAKMHPRALEWWNEHKEKIIELAIKVKEEK